MARRPHNMLDFAVFVNPSVRVGVTVSFVAGTGRIEAERNWATTIKTGAYE
jgi:hypothetical protein